MKERKMSIETELSRIASALEDLIAEYREECPKILKVGPAIKGADVSTEGNPGIQFAKPKATKKKAAPVKAVEMPAEPQVDEPFPVVDADVIIPTLATVREAVRDFIKKNEDTNRAKAINILKSVYKVAQLADIPAVKYAEVIAHFAGLE